MQGTLEIAGASESGVAGIRLPAFVERSTRTTPTVTRSPVSPGLDSRPSLSVRAKGHDAGRVAVRVSPGLDSRPSLSAALVRPEVVRQARVAGIRLPAFVERGMSRGAVTRGAEGVAGIRLPAFVERTGSPASRTSCSPGVAGIRLPAFVERCHLRRSAGTRSRCRRD